MKEWEIIWRLKSIDICESVERLLGVMAVCVSQDFISFSAEPVVLHGA